MTHAEVLTDLASYAAHALTRNTSDVTDTNEATVAQFVAKFRASHPVSEKEMCVLMLGKVNEVEKRGERSRCASFVG